jgi:hypothetical protein
MWLSTHQTCVPSTVSVGRCTVVILVVRQDQCHCVPPSHLTLLTGALNCVRAQHWPAPSYLAEQLKHFGQENKVQDPVLEEMNGGTAPPKHVQGRCVTTECTSEPSYALQEGKEEVSLLHEERVLH